MSYKGRYYSETHASQQQGYRNFLQDSICFQSMDTEDNCVDDLDPEKLLECPYDRSHKIRACRFPYHLVKCRKNHPDIVQKLVTCPFNARHQIPKEELSKHIASCDDKRFIEQDIVSQVNNHKREVNVISSWQCPPCEEDWDEDLVDQSNSVFIWGTSRCVVNSSGSNPTVERKNRLPSCLRAPRSLPYEVLPWKKNAGN